MPSPFPGMNPYLEQARIWGDFHHTFIAVMRAALVPQIVPRYFVKIEEQLYIHEPEAEARRMFARADIDVERLARLEIHDRDNRELITDIEVLSPTNKYRGADRDQYEAKRGNIQASRTHLVEIDLLCGGPRMPVADAPPCDYCALVSRCEQRPRADFWPIRLRERLPAIPVPLRPGEAEAVVDLQDVLHQSYDTAGYHSYIYAHAPEPALSPADAAWAAQFVPPRP